MFQSPTLPYPLCEVKYPCLIPFPILISTSKEYGSAIVKPDKTGAGERIWSLSILSQWDTPLICLERDIFPNPIKTLGILTGCHVKLIVLIIQTKPHTIEVGLEVVGPRVLWTSLLI